MSRSFGLKLGTFDFLQGFHLDTVFLRAVDQDRTGDNLLGRQKLYRLSYHRRCDFPDEAGPRRSVRFEEKVATTCTNLWPPGVGSLYPG